MNQRPYLRRVELHLNDWVEGMWTALLGILVSGALVGSWTSILRRDAGAAWIVFASIATMLMIGLFIKRLREMIKAGPAIILDSLGIRLLLGLDPMGLVSWDDIQGFRIRTFNRQVLIAIEVSNPAAYIRRGWWPTQLIRLIEYWVFNSPIHIPTFRLKRKPEAIMQLFEQYLGEWRESGDDSPESPSRTSRHSIRWGD